LSHTKKTASAVEEKCKNFYEALQKEKSILEEMLNETENMHLVFLDRDFNFVRVNEAYAKTCGYKPAEMIGKNHFDLYSNEENEAIFRRVRDTGVPAEFHDKPFVFPDQPERGVTYWDWMLKPVKNEAGEVDGLVFSLVETTERKKAEEEIQNLAKFPSENPNPVLRIDKNGYFLYCNDAAIQSLKASKCNIGEVIPEGWRTFVDAAFASGKRQEFEEQIGERTFVFAVSPVTDYVNVYGHDITERKKAEEVLQEQSVAISSAPDAIFSTNSSFVFKSWNEAAERIFGWKAEEVIGKAPTSIFNIKYPTLNGVNRKRALKILMDTGFWKGEIIYHKKDGSPIPVSVSVSLVKDKADNITGTVAVIHDISKRKRREEALRRSLKIARQRAEELETLRMKLEDKAVEIGEYATHMEQLAEERAMKLQDAERLAAIGATAAMVGHDIRNPLQAIMGDLYLIASDVVSFPESEEKESIKESTAAIRKNIAYINKIIQDLQDYAKSHKPDLRRVDLEEIIQKLFVETDFPENVDAKYCVEEEAKEIVADPALVERILSNLVINAVQAMPEGGKLDIQSRRENGEVVLTVEDSGVGIPADCRGKLFTPLFTTKAKGQGFGLAVVKRMTEALEGTVTFESEEGKRTKFIVRLPCTKIANGK
jgi:PAS domain S-box-containing protein